MNDNEKLIREAYDAMARGDGRGLGGLLTPRSRWIIAGKGQLAGTYTGPDEIFGLWKAIASQTGGGLRLRVDDVLANDRRVVVLVSATGERLGRSLDERQVAIFEIDNGKVDVATFIYEDSEAYDEFWA